MAYLDNKSIVVDAVLTKKGRELLAKNGGLNVTSFALADDEIDYSLYNPNASSADLMEVALVNTPVFEPNIDETQVMKYKLVTLDQGTTFIPTISIAQSSISIDSSYTGKIIISPSTTPSNYNAGLGYTAVLANNNVGNIITTVQAPNASSVTGTVAVFGGDVSSAASQTLVGLEFAFVPSQALGQTTTTTLTIIGNESGGGVTIPVTVTVTS
jgi:hypothetical protein